MQLDAKTTWWLTFALVAIQGLNTIAWATLGLDPRWVAGIGQGVGYLTLLLTFAIHGSLPGIPPVQMPKAIIFLALGFGALLLAGDADAQQPRPRPVPTPQPVFCDPLKLIPGCTEHETADTDNLSPAVIWKRIAAVSLPDLTYAKALADSAAISNPAGGGTGRSACLAAIIDLNKQTSGTNIPKNPDGTPMPFPDPHLISGVEMAAEILDELGPNAPVMAKCAAAAQAARMNALAFVNAIVTGAVSFTALGAGIP